MTRKWSDGDFEDTDRQKLLEHEQQHRDRLVAEKVRLELVNDFLRGQISEPLNIDNYREFHKRPAGTRREVTRALGATA